MVICLQIPTAFYIGGRNTFQLLNVHNVSDDRQIEIHTTEPLIPGPSHLEVEIAIAKLKKYKSSGSDQIPAELIEAGGETLVSAIHKLINSLWNEEELPDEWNESVHTVKHSPFIIVFSCVPTGQ
jgi:hypothetical protein